MSIGNETKGKVRTVKLSADSSGFLAALGVSGGNMQPGSQFGVLVDAKEDVAQWAPKQAMPKKRTQVKW